MTQLSAASPPTPGIAAVQTASASASPGGDAAAGTEGAADFAAVLQAQIARPAKDASGAENFAALPLPRAEEAVEEAPFADALAAGPGLAALLPGLMAPTTPPAATGQPQKAEAPAAGSQSSAAAATLTAATIATAPASETPDFEAVRSVPQASAQPTVPTVQTARAEAAVDLPLPVAAAEPAAPISQAPVMASPGHAARADNPGPVVHVDIPVGARGWDAEVGQKIVLLASRQESRAELTLTPPQLGRVEVSIMMQGDQTSAAFVSASSAAREALEQALPRLREILAEAGITLGQASVNAESPRQDREAAQTGPHAGTGRDRGPGAAAAAAPTQWLRRSEGLVDTFA